MHFTRLGSLHLREKLDRSDDGQDHTVLPYARFAASPQYSSALSTLPKNCRRDEPQQRRSSTRGFGLTGTPRPARTSRIQRCLRPPQARLAIKTTQDRPSRMSWVAATDTIFPNFGKVEYFCGEGLTGWRGVLGDGPSGCLDQITQSLLHFVTVQALRYTTIATIAIAPKIPRMPSARICVPNNLISSRWGFRMTSSVEFFRLSDASD